MVTAIASKRNKKPLFNSADLLALAFVTALAAADQVAKEVIRKSITHPLQLGLLQITYTTNTGSVFGLFPGSSSLIVAVSAVVLPVLIVIHMKHLINNKFQKAAVIFIAAGLVGNTIDRLFRGAVTDFIYIRPWPAFNLADSFLTIGIFLFAASLLLPQVFRKRRK